MGVKSEGDLLVALGVPCADETGGSDGGEGFDAKRGVCGVDGDTITALLWGVCLDRGGGCLEKALQRPCGLLKDADGSGLLVELKSKRERASGEPEDPMPRFAIRRSFEKPALCGVFEQRSAQADRFDLECRQAVGLGFG